jgi:hypothetical protein
MKIQDPTLRKLAAKLAPETRSARDARAATGHEGQGLKDRGDLGMCRGLRSRESWQGQHLALRIWERHLHHSRRDKPRAGVSNRYSNSDVTAGA